MVDDDPERCYRTAVRILNHRFNSTAELERKLRAKGFSREVIDPIVERLAAEKWLDDARYAGAFVRTRVQKRVGKLRIRRELIRAGVSDDLIAQAVGENVDPEDERARALAVAQKRFPILIRRYGPVVARNKLAAYLLNQGYDAGLVREVIKDTKGTSS
jgi:regulatory protein